MTKIKWSAEALRKIQDDFYTRVGFNAPAPRHAYDINRQQYIEGLSDDELQRIGSAVAKEVKGLVNGWPEKDKVDDAHRSLSEHYPWVDRDDDGWDRYSQYIRDWSCMNEDIKTIEQLAHVLLEGIHLSGDRQKNYELVRNKLFRHYDNIVQLAKKQTELSGMWANVVNKAAVYTLDCSGHSYTVHTLLRTLADEKKRRIPKTPEEIAEEEARKKALLDEPWYDEDEDRRAEMEWYEAEIDQLEDLLIENQKKVIGYEAILEELNLILASKATLEEKHAALEKTLHTNWLYAELSETEVDKSLARPHVTQRYKDAVYKLNGIPNIKGKTFTASFKPHDQDGSIGNGHSKQMLALRTGIVIDYDSQERLKFTVHRRRRNDGNDVDCEIHDGDKRVQAIVTLECDERDDFVVVTIKTYENKYWQQAEENLLRKNYKKMRQPVTWFADWYPKLCEEAARLIELDDQKIEKKGQG